MGDFCCGGLDDLYGFVNLLGQFGKVYAGDGDGEVYVFGGDLQVVDIAVEARQVTLCITDDDLAEATRSIPKVGTGFGIS